MMNKIMWVLAALLCARASLASGQSSIETRAFVTVNGGYQVTANDFSHDAVVHVNAEDGHINTTYAVKAGPSFEVAGGVVIWRQLGLGVGVTHFSVDTPVSVTATIPHPFFFNNPRSISGTASGLHRDELGIHVQIRGVFPVSARVQVMVFGGPSFYQVKQGVVTDVTYTDSYPYDTAKFNGATTTTEQVSKIGFNAGGDVAFFFAKQIGVGATAQFAGTTVELPIGGGSQDAKVGGFTVGGGLRLRF